MFKKFIFLILTLSLPLVCFAEDVSLPPSNLPTQGLEGVVSEDYRLGPLDSLQVSIWGAVSYDYHPTRGAVSYDYHLTISPQGKVFIPLLGDIFISGLTLKEAKEKISSELSKYIRDFQLTVVVTGLRNIKVFVLGEVKVPGVYVVNSLVRVAEVISLAGGPNSVGSLRDVRLIREGKELSSIDLYRFLGSGDKGQNPGIEAGDIIFIPPLENTIRIVGEIQATKEVMLSGYSQGGKEESKKESRAESFIYKLGLREKIREVIINVGGLTPQASLREARIERVKQDGKKEVIALDLYKLMIEGDLSQNVELRSGDTLIIPSLRDVIYVCGEVKSPGAFPFEEGRKVTDYLGLAGGALDKARLSRAQIMRGDETIKLDLRKIMEGKSLGPPLQPGDTILIPKDKRMDWRDFLSVILSVATLQNLIQ